MRFKVEAKQDKPYGSDEVKKYLSITLSDGKFTLDDSASANVAFYTEHKILASVLESTLNNLMTHMERRPQLKGG